MKRLGIVQPGPLRNIITCLPIAKWYSEEGYEIIWPVDKNLIKNLQGYIDYAKFIPIDFHGEAARQYLKTQSCADIIDLSLYIPGASIFNMEVFMYQNKYTYDLFMYTLANLPITEKWRLDIKRNHAKEEELYNKLVGDEKDYVVLSTKSFYGNRDDIVYEGELKQIVHTPLTDSIFDWIKILENAKMLALINGSMHCLVDQLRLNKTAQKIVLVTNLVNGMKTHTGFFKNQPQVGTIWQGS